METCPVSSTGFQPCSLNPKKHAVMFYWLKKKKKRSEWIHWENRSESPRSSRWEESPVKNENAPAVFLHLHKEQFDCCEEKMNILLVYFYLWPCQLMYEEDRWGACEPTDPPESANTRNSGNKVVYYLSRLIQASWKEPGDWMWEIKVLVMRVQNGSRSR